MRFKFLTLLAFLFSTLSLAAQPLTVYMAGDSTMAIKEVKDYPETGWGVPFSIFFDENVKVDNRAKNGRSTRTFISEGRWQSIMDTLQAGDYVIIQFGHNDEHKKKVDRYTTPEQYRANLTRFVNETRAKKATPILMTPIVRRKFDDSGVLQDSHPVYADIVRDVAAKLSVNFVDAEQVTKHLVQEWGVQGSLLRFMHIKPGLHPNYPVGVSDNTHLNRLGAREVAEAILADLKRQNHPLATRLRTSDPKHLKLVYKD